MDRNETIGVKTTLANGRVEQTIDGLTKRVVDIAAQHQDAAVREALTQLGWTSPEESEELRRDAERYKWLRDKANYARKSDPMVCINPLGRMELVDGRELDEAMDEAMRAKPRSNNDAAIDSARGVDNTERGAG